MLSANVAKTIKQKYQLVRPELDERGRRLWAASEAMVLGHGGAVAVARATGLGRSTIQRGLEELRQKKRQRSSMRVRRVRLPGGGRKPLNRDRSGDS